MMLTHFPAFRSPFKSGSALASRLCKAAMLHRFRLVAKENQRQDLLATSSYREAKVRETVALFLGALLSYSAVVFDFHITVVFRLD